MKSVVSWRIFNNNERCLQQDKPCYTLVGRSPTFASYTPSRLGGGYQMDTNLGIISMPKRELEVWQCRRVSEWHSQCTRTRERANALEHDSRASVNVWVDGTVA